MYVKKKPNENCITINSHVHTLKFMQEKDMLSENV